jgi:ATP-dependent RNA helicase RhlE
VATPGRLLDLLGQRALTLQHVEFFTLDEADRMLDMGFVHDVKRICALLPARRQTLLFSATMPGEIRKLADGLLRQPVKVEVAPVSSTAEKIDQNVYHVSKDGKTGLLRHILADEAVKRVLVFTRTKHGADRLQRSLEKYGIPAEAIHGNKSQGARVRSLTNFKDGSSRVLVATDLAARGIDVDDISHVVNYDLPNEPETYVHRIGRTGRAGRTGISFSFCAPDDTGYLRDIERLIRMRIQVAPTPAETELRTPEPQAVRDRDAGRDRESGNGQGNRQGGNRNGGESRHRRGNRGSESGEGRNERRDSGHRRASTGHNPASRLHEGRSESPAPAANGNAKDTRPSHLRGQGEEPRSHGRGPAKRGGGRTFVREYYSNR